MMSAFPSSLDTDKLFLVEGQAVVVDEEAEGVRYARHRETTNIVINATTALPSSCRKNDRPGFFQTPGGHCGDWIPWQTSKDQQTGS